MLFDELKKSISELSTEELHEQMRLIRQRRRQRPERAVAKAKTAKVTLPTAINMDLAALLTAMEEMITNAPATDSNK